MRAFGVMKTYYIRAYTGLRLLGCIRAEDANTAELDWLREQEKNFDVVKGRGFWDEVIATTATPERTARFEAQGWS